MTQTARFDALIDRIEVLYNNHQPNEALELLDAESTGLEPWAAELAHVKALPARRGRRTGRRAQDTAGGECGRRLVGSVDLD